MDLSENERTANDLTKTGKFCPSDNYELEKVSSENRYICRLCGGIFILDEKGEIKDSWFKGFE